MILVSNSYLDDCVLKSDRVNILFLGRGNRIKVIE